MASSQTDYLRIQANKCIDKGNYSAAIDYYVKLRDTLLETSHGQNQAIYQVNSKIIKLYNAIAMKCIQAGIFYLLCLLENYQGSLVALRKAEEIAGKHDELKVATFNNFACLYRKLNKPKSALTFLEHALNIEYRYLNTIPNDEEFTLSMIRENPADTHLNLCAVLSLIGKHEIAYSHALKALTFLQAEIIDRKESNPKGSEIKPFMDRCAVLCIAYHNLAAELEFLKRVN